MNPITIHQGDALTVLRTLPDKSVNCCVTSPPYWGLRDYGVDGQLGLEKTPEDYVTGLVAVFREVRRVLRGDGTLWLNLGDSYNAAGREGHGTRVGFKQGTNRASANGSDRTRPSALSLKPKDLVGIPWRVAFALQADGWYLRQDIIWAKPNPMPESVKDRCTKGHEYVFLLSKDADYYFDYGAMQEPATCPQGSANKETDTYIAAAASDPRMRTKAGLAKIGPREFRNRRSVWTVATKPYKGSHFATFPPMLITPMILAGCPAGGTVLDPFAGSGTTGMVALEHGRNAVLIELNPAYIALINQRCNVTMGLPL